MGRTDRGNHLLSAWLTVWRYRVITIIPIIQRHRVIIFTKYQIFHKSPWSWPAADCIAGKCSSRSWIPSTGSAGSPSCSESRYSTEKTTQIQNIYMAQRQKYHFFVHLIFMTRLEVCSPVCSPCWGVWMPGSAPRFCWPEHPEPRPLE